MPRLSLRPLPAPLPALDALPEGSTSLLEVDEPNAYPCRRCLRDAEPGEQVLLFSYDPFTGDSPYRQPGPIFVHERHCAREPVEGMPDQLARRLLSVRSFDRDHFMLGGVVVPGVELESTALRLLESPDVAYLHVHNAGPGCFAVRIDREA